MKPSYLHEREVPQEEREKVLDEQSTTEGKQRALEKLFGKEVFLDQELATSEDPLKIKDYIHQKEQELQTGISINEWALFRVGA